jgi:predicted O-methyltransferase YrrM
MPKFTEILVGAGGDSPFGRMKGHPDHYQGLLCDLIKKEKPDKMIETGVESGFSTELFVAALVENGKGHLWSVDPNPTPFWMANPIEHPRFTMVIGKSEEALDALYARIGPVDMFLHDSDHSFKNQTYEYEWAFSHVRSGGIIASDDTGWADVPGPGHGAWDKFLARHGLTGHDVTINNAKWVRRP